MGRRPYAGRQQRRICRRGGGRSCCSGVGLGWWRFHSHSVDVVRPVRHQAPARPRAVGTAPRRVERPVRQRSDRPHRRRRGAVLGRHHGLGRHHRDAGAGRRVCRRCGAPAGQAANRVEHQGSGTAGRPCREGAAPGGPRCGCAAARARPRRRRARPRLPGHRDVDEHDPALPARGGRRYGDDAVAAAGGGANPHDRAAGRPVLGSPDRRDTRCRGPDLRAGAVDLRRRRRGDHAGHRNGSVANRCLPAARRGRDAAARRDAGALPGDVQRDGTTGRGGAVGTRRGRSSVVHSVGRQAV